MALHALALALLFALGKTQTEKIQEREREVLEEVERQRQVEEREQRQEEVELAREELKDQLMMPLDDFLAGELSPGDEAALRDRLDAALAGLVDSAFAGEAFDAWTQDKLTQLEERLADDALAALRQSLSRMAEDAVLWEIHRYVQEVLAPAFKERGERELGTRTDAVVAGQVTAALKGRPADASATAGTEVVARLVGRLRTTVATEIDERAIPDMTRQLLAKVNAELERVGWTHLALTTNLSTAVEETLREATAGEAGPDSSVALRTAAGAVGVDLSTTKDPAALPAAKIAELLATVDPPVAASAVDSIARAYRNIVAELELSAGTKESLAKLDHVAGTMESLHARTTTFRLGHSVMTYEEMLGPEGEEGDGNPIDHQAFGGPSDIESSGDEPHESHQSGGREVGMGIHETDRDEATFNRYGRVNRGVYRLYRNFISRREAVADDTNEVPASLTAGAKTTVAVAETGEWPKEAFVEILGVRMPPRPEDDADRPVPEPPFETLAAGAAQFQRTPLVVDGDLGDWGELRHPIQMRWTFSGQRLTDGVVMFMRWSPQGFYFGYRVPGKTAVEPNVKTQWEGDCFEVWLDVDNLRKAYMENSPYTQQFCLMPFGFAGTPSHTFVEIGRGFRGFKMYEARLEKSADLAVANGKAVGRVDAGGYTVEGFISSRALAKPRLAAGMYLGMNVSINLSYDKAISQQWSLPKSVQTFDKPDTWGDLLLLGTDATARFLEADDPARAPTAIVAGQPLGVEVADEDMNVNATARDKVLAAVQVKDSRSYLYLILEETEVDSGVFRGSFDTQPHFLPANQTTLSVRDGSPIVLTYRDGHSAFGERNRIVRAELLVGVPMYRLGRL